VAQAQATKQPQQVAQPKQAASTQVAEAAGTAEPIKVKDVKQQSNSSAGGSSAGGSSSDRRASIKTDSANVLAYIGTENAPIADTVLSLEPTISSDSGYTSMNPVVSTELGDGDKKILVLKGVVTQSGVIQAMRTDYSQVDPGQCRASAHGRCLLF
jgi:hypothetical protein